MHIFTVLRVLGLLLMVFSATMLPPILVSQIYHEFLWFPFLISFIVTFLFGLLLWLPCRKFNSEIKVREGFLIAALFWIVLSFFGSLPFILTHLPEVNWTDAIFESVSGLTTTGTSVFQGIDQLPFSILYYRQQLQFLGGMGIVVLAIAILPMLGIGGMQLFRTEIPGPVKDQKLTPRIAETAKTLWLIYLGLTASCALAYWLAGMTGFEALVESFSTVSTGGFSVHDDSLGYYQSTEIEIIASFFMLSGAVNFGLHYTFLNRRSFFTYWKDAECRAFLWIIFIMSILLCTTLITHEVYPHTYTAIIQSIFTTISLATTTGYTSGNFSAWPTFLPYLMMFIALIGGCAGSTSGGLKVMRILLLQKQGNREMKRLLHPQGVFTIKFDQQVISESVIQSICGFIVIFILLFLILLLILLWEGMDFTTAFGAIAACLSNTGTGIGKIAHGFDDISHLSKIVLIIGMLAGRLEIFTLLVLFTPTFWKR